MRLVGMALCVLILAGCSTAPAVSPSGAVADYQLGGAYPPPTDVTAVTRDSLDEPADGLYSICYVNGFQTQPGSDWPDELVLLDGSARRTRASSTRGAATRSGSTSPPSRSATSSTSAPRSPRSTATA